MDWEDDEAVMMRRTIRRTMRSPVGMRDDNACGHRWACGPMQGRPHDDTARLVMFFFIYVIIAI